jgi:hypothetical protein
MDISDYELNYKESEGIMMTADEIKSIEKQIQENLRFTGCYSVLKNASKRQVLLQTSHLWITKWSFLWRSKFSLRFTTLAQISHWKNLETHKLIKHDTEGMVHLYMVDCRILFFKL